MAGTLTNRTPQGYRPQDTLTTMGLSTKGAHVQMVSLELLVLSLFLSLSLSLPPSLSLSLSLALSLSLSLVRATPPPAFEPDIAGARFSQQWSD
eukprot:COSAG03_NODE_1528_length_3931_cov_2.471816_3_plen_94_part_00